MSSKVAEAKHIALGSERLLTSAAMLQSYLFYLPDPRRELWGQRGWAEVGGMDEKQESEFGNWLHAKRRALPPGLIRSSQ